MIAPNFNHATGWQWLFRIPPKLATLISLLFCAISPGVADAADFVIDGVPVPADAAPMPNDGSPFAGTWIGRWDGFLKTILIVESISESGTAKLIYAIADNPSGAFKRAWFRVDGKIANGEMTVRGAGISLHLKPGWGGRLRAVFGDGFSYAILSKRDLSSLTASDATIHWSPGASEMIETDLFENGQPINLETVIFKPDGNGPFPLAVINHGSTGFGNDATAFTHTWTNEWLADVLNQRGWMVAFPQRRGRGKSGGLYDEGFGADRSQGYTCDAGPSLAGADRALEDLHAAIVSLRQRSDVLTVPLLLAGQSRGGMLSVAYAGLHPEMAGGVINFVGGWMGDLCKTASTINQTLARKAGEFKNPMLWIYGEDDLYYSIAHSRKNFDAFIQAGGTGSFETVVVRGQNTGHWVLAVPPLWSDLVDSYLQIIDHAE